MKLKKQILCLVLGGAMAVTLLSGCGNTGTAEKAGNSTPSSADGEASSEFTGFDELQEITVYSCSFFGDAGVDEVEDAVNAISEEAINVRIDFQPLDVASYMQQVGLMLSGGESFDLMQITPIPVVSFYTMQSQNELLDISEYLEEYGPNLLDLVGEYLPAMSLEDSVYGVPILRLYNSDQYILMRKDVLDYLGLTEKAENISSWTEFEEILLAVHDAQDTLPEELRTNCAICNSDQGGAVFTNAGYNVAAENFAECESFDNLGDLNKVIYVDSETNTVQCWPETEDYRTAIERAHKWYQEGLIYKDAATSDEAGDVMVSNGVAFAEATQAEYGAENTKAAAIGYELVAIRSVAVDTSTANVNKWGWGVPVTSKNPEAAVAFLNLLYSNKEINNLLAYGIEGRDYELNENGEAVVLENAVYRASDFNQGNQFVIYPPVGSGSTFREDSYADMQASANSPYFGCVVNTDSISNELTAISTVLNKYQPGLECGATDPSVLDTMIEELYASGMQTVLDYYQAELDEWLAQQ